MNIAESQYKAGALSENDFQKIRLQLLQFQADIQHAQFSRVQALSDLRQQLGYDAVPPDYGVSGPFEYWAVTLSLEELQKAALQNRPDLRSAELSIVAAMSQYELAKANGKRDVTVSGNYSHVNGGSHATTLAIIPLPIFDRNQGETARTLIAGNQARHREAALRGQVMTDVKDAYEALQMGDRVTQYYDQQIEEMPGRALFRILRPMPTKCGVTPIMTGDLLTTKRQSCCCQC